MNGKDKSKAQKKKASTLYGEMPKNYQPGQAKVLAREIGINDMLIRAIAWYFGHPGVRTRGHSFSKVKQQYRIQCEFFENGKYADYETSYRGWDDTWHEALIDCYRTFLTDRNRIAFSTEEALG